MDLKFSGLSVLPCLFVAMVLQVTIVESYKILMVSPSHSKSHLIIASSVLKGLAEEGGHNVTMISSFPQKEKIPNYRDIYLEVPPALQNLFENAVASETSFTLRSSYGLLSGLMAYSNSTMGLLEVQRLMREESFDVVISSVVGGRMLSGLAAHFKCPLIYIFPVRAPLYAAYEMGNPIQLSSVPSLFSAIQNPMSFIDRVKSVFYSAIEVAMFYVWDVMEKSYYDSNFPQPKYPPYHEASRNVSLILSAHHFSQGAIANVPQIVEIGGIQMDVKLAPLSEVLEHYLNNATDGVIFMSFGTNLKLKKQNQTKIWALLRALGRTNMKVLLKYDTDEEIPGLPNNILSAEWLPQREILAHPNVKLFISHGGLGSIMEAKYYGVPVLGLPIFGDQPANINAAVKEGWAVEVDFFSLTEEKMSLALDSVINNSSYSETVKRLSNIYRDRPMSPTETANYWIEYVIRHQGAPHMRSPAKDMNYFQRNSLDVAAFVCLIICVALLFVNYLIKGGWKMAKKVYLLLIFDQPNKMKEHEVIGKKKA